MSNNDIAIRVENLSKKFTLQHAVKDEHGNNTHELWALKDVSFEIKKGESVGIIGPNGSGKSTLLKILAGVTKPTTGKVEIYGRVASILDIGAGFHPELSGRENVFLNGQLLGFSKKEIQSKFDEIVDFSGIEKFIDEPVKNYSNGMYLRLAFSIMAHLDFDVYLFDEVFSVGDEEFQNKCIERIQAIAMQCKTAVFVYHNLFFADRIVNKEIDIRNFQSDLYNIGRINDSFGYNDELIIENGILKNFSFSNIYKNSSAENFELAVVLKSSTGVVLSVSNVLYCIRTNGDTLSFTANINLSKGKYFLMLYELNENNFKLISTTKIVVLYGHNKLKNFNSMCHSSTIMDIDLVV